MFLTRVPGNLGRSDGHTNLNCSTKTNNCNFSTLVQIGKLFKVSHYILYHTLIELFNFFNFYMPYLEGEEGCVPGKGWVPGWWKEALLVACWGCNHSLQVAAKPSQISLQPGNKRCTNFN